MEKNSGTVDVHSHAIPDFLRDALTEAKRSPSLSGFPAWSPDLALETMARFGITRTILSVSTPGVHFGNDELARVLARRFNEYCTDLGATYTSKFGLFAALPLPDIDAACREACYALDELKVDGIGLLASYESFFLGDSCLDGLMAELNTRNAVVFVHPAGHPTSRGLPLDYPQWMLEYPIDTTRAAVNLLMAQTTTRFPNIRWILAHNGGALPYLAWRISSAPLIDKRYAHLNPAKIIEEIGKFYYEIAQSPGAEAFGSLLAVADPSHILFGTDWPYCNHNVVEHLEASFSNLKHLSEEERFAIRYKNSMSIFSPPTRAH
jgi:predicted TIM-barrel fold metal-dependent hydrolase